MADRISVHVVDNGPIKISGEGVSLRYCGATLSTKPGKDLYLCRCGESSNPPFCDGTHSKEGFMAEPPQGQKKEVKVWEGKTIRTFFNPNACMHVFYCKPLKALREAELGGDTEAAEEIARVVQSCPSGALSFESTEVPPPQAPELADIEVMEGGELRIQCKFDINAELQERQEPNRATLCRCGLSKNKPWCDGRHKRKENFR